MKTTIIKAALALAAAGVLALGGLYYFVLRNDSPAAVSLESALQSINTEAEASGATSSGTTTSTAVTSNDGYEGEWAIVQGASSFVGYRVQEQLVGVGATTAVGRTQGVSGSLTFDGSTISELEVTADLSTLASDKSMRDQALRMQALQTGTYPKATFVLTSPVQIGSVPAEGQTISQTITGNLTLHGVTKQVQITVEAQIKDGQLVVVGSTEIQFADYGIEQPRSASVLSIDDHGTLELQLLLAQV